MADVIGRAIIQVAPDVTNFARQLTRDLNKAFRGFKKVSVGVSVGSLRKAFVEVSKLNVALRAAVVGFTLLGGKVVVAGLLSAASAAVELSGALGVVPAAAAGASLALGALAVGLHGVDDVFKALVDRDMKKFNEALAELSPKAQQSLGVLKKLAPEIEKFRDAVQDALLGDLGPTIQTLSDKLLPRLQKSFVDIATEFNKTARGVADFITSAQTLRDVDDIIRRTTTTVKLLTPSVVPLVQIFRDLAVVGSQFLPQLAREFTSAVIDLRDFVSAARESGALAEFIANGLAKLRQLVGAVIQLGQAIFGVLRIADEAGFGIVDIISNIAASFNKFVKSAEGQTAFRNFFTSAHDAASALAPVLKALFLLITNNIAPVLAQFATIIGPSLVVFITAIGRAFDAARPGIEAFAVGMGKFIESIAPALPKIGELAGVLAEVFGRVLERIGPTLEKFISLVANELIKLFNDPTFVDSILDIADAIGDFFIALVPLLPVLADLVRKLLPFFADLIRIITPLIEPLVDVIDALVDILEPFLEVIKFIGMALSGWIFVIAKVVEGIIRLVEIVVDAFRIFDDAVNFALFGITPGTEPTPIENTLGRIDGKLGESGSAVEDYKNRVQVSFLGISEYVDARMGEVGSALTGLEGPLNEAGMAVFGFETQVSGSFTTAAGAAQTQLNLIGAAARGTVKPIGEAGTAAGIGYAGGLFGGLGPATETARTIGRSAADGMGETGQFSSAGSAVTRAFAGGMTNNSALEAVRNASRLLASVASGSLPRSPAKEGPFSGRGWTPFRGHKLAVGFAEGITAGTDVVARAARDLASAATVQFDAVRSPDPRLFAATEAQTRPPIVVQPPATPAVTMQPEVRVFVDGKEMRVIATEVVDERDRRMRRSVLAGVGGAQ